MKTLFTLVLVIFFFLGCNPTPEQPFKETDKKDTGITRSKKIEKPVIDTNEINKKAEYPIRLVPIDTVDSKNKDVFKRYGIEFDGNCYTCDLAELSISDKTIQLVNVCDEKRNKSFDIITISKTDNSIEIKTAQNNFVFIKIDKAPVYELKITGNTIQVELLRLSTYYTLKKILKKFEEHDCGDFQG
ncbi:MAG: hypothetical protein JST87_10235 [Bacteroidetes bacterium]|nr:hypothetical protein [Bacteroidota bacterium]